MKKLLFFVKNNNLTHEITQFCYFLANCQMLLCRVLGLFIFMQKYLVWPYDEVSRKKESTMIAKTM